MAKIVQFSITSIGIILLLATVGAPTFTSQMLNAFFNSGAQGVLTGNFDLTNGGFIIGLGLVLAFSAGLIAFVANVFRPDPSVIVAALVSALILWFSADMFSLIAMTSSFGILAAPMRVLFVLIFAVYEVGFITSAVAWWRGVDI